MTKKSDAPAIRFKGFSDAWEQRKAIDIADYSKGNGYSKGDLTDVGTPIILYGRLYTKYQFVINEVDTFAVPRNVAVYSQGNEVIVPASGETAEDIARASAVEKSGVLLGGDLNILRPFDFINPLFLALAISNGEPQKELAKKAQGKSVVHIHNTDIQEVTIAYPSKTEQDRIVSVFRQLDNLITLHQRKFEKLTNVKKSMLEKMFPQNGSSCPEIRFKGFTDPWEQRKLGDIGKARSGVGFPDADQGGLTGVPFFKVSDMNSDGNENEMTVANNYVTTEQIADHRWSPITELPAIFFAKVGAAVMLNRKRLCRFPFLLDNNTMAYSLSPTKWDADFAKALFGTVDLTSLVQVGALPSYNAGDVESMEIYLPSLLEQEQIGAYFKHLDNLITLHQRKCALLFSPFQALISMMFTTSTFSWEQRKVSDMFKVTRGYVLAATLTNDTKSDEMPYPVYSSQTKDFGLMGYYRDYLYENSITWTTDGANAGTVNYRAGKFYCTNVCGVLLSDKVNASQMIAEALNNVAKGYVSYVGNPKLMNNVMSDIEIMIPVSPMEQKRISDYFATLDHLITLHQRKPFLMKWRTSDANRNQTNRLVL